MPSALRASRDFVSQALARVRSGVDRYAEDLDRPGLDIKVEPFDAHNASTAAGLVKLGTSIAKSRRDKANLEAAQADIELEREKTRAEIAKIRAEEKYALGEGRQSGGDGPAVLSQDIGPYAKGTPVSTANAGFAQTRIEDARKNAQRRAASAGKLSAAREGMKQLDAAVNRDVSNRVAHGLQSAEGTFRRIMLHGNKELDDRTTTPNGPPRTLRDDLMDVGIDPISWKAHTDYNRSAMLRDARAGLAKRYEPGYRRQIETYFSPKRQQFQDIIDQASLGDDELDIEGDQNYDVLGIE
jgi:hypothetical protein